MTGWVEDRIASGKMQGDPEQIGLMYWASAHGAVVLELAGKIPQGAAREIHHALATTLAKGLKPGA
jgi:hypothetical protein